MSLDALKEDIAQAHDRLQESMSAVREQRVLMQQVESPVRDYDSLCVALRDAGHLNDQQSEPTFSMLGMLLAEEARNANEFRDGLTFLQDVLQNVCEFNVHQSFSPHAEQLADDLETSLN